MFPYFYSPGYVVANAHATADTLDCMQGEATADTPDRMQGEAMQHWCPRQHCRASAQQLSMYNGTDNTSLPSCCKKLC
jgi:hypothetical protein